MHALNNLFGAPQFQVPTMLRAAELYHEDKPRDGGLEDGESLADHILDSGWYSVEVMAFAIGNICRLFRADGHKHVMSLDASRARDAFTSSDDCVGAQKCSIG